MKLPFTEPIAEIIPEMESPHYISLLKEYSALLEEMRNFGSHILKWDFEKPREGKDNHIPSLFLRNALDLIDGISILLSQYSIDPAKQLVRSLFENQLYLMYLIEKNEKKRAQCFIVCKNKNDIKELKRLISKEPTSKELSAKLLKENPKFRIQEFLDKEPIENILFRKVEALKKEELKPFVIEYEKLKRERYNNTKIPVWYNFFGGPRKIQDLAAYFKKSLEYEFKYKSYSQAIHARHVTKGFSFVEGKKNTAQIIQIKDLEDSQYVTKDVIQYGVETIHFFINKRLPNKISEFDKWLSQFIEEKNSILAKQFNYQK